MRISATTCHAEEFLKCYPLPQSAQTDQLALELPYPPRKRLERTTGYLSIQCPRLQIVQRHETA